MFSLLAPAAPFPYWPEQKLRGQPLLRLHWPEQKLCGQPQRRLLWPEQKLLGQLQGRLHWPEQKLWGQRQRRLLWHEQKLWGQPQRRLHWPEQKLCGQPRRRLQCHCTNLSRSYEGTGNEDCTPPHYWQSLVFQLQISPKSIPSLYTKIIASVSRRYQYSW